MNYANRGRVNGPSMGTSGSGMQTTFFSNLEAVVVDSQQPSKLLVGPRWLDRFLWRPLLPFVFGPYWVVALKTDDKGDYLWAIISGGAPEIETDKGCATGHRYLSRYQVNGVGLWLFSRQPVDPDGAYEMRKMAEELGYDVSVLYPVQHKGCKYENAIIKNATTATV